MFTKHFNDTTENWKANRDIDMDWSVCGMEWHSTERRRAERGGRRGDGVIMEAVERKHSEGAREDIDTMVALQVLDREAGKVGCRWMEKGDCVYERERGRESEEGG